jgi:hypothetical protein
MQKIEFTSEELELLHQVLEADLAAMDVELLHTDSREFKSHLKQRRDTLERLLTRLPAVPVAA